VVARRVDFSIYRNSFLGLNGLKYRHGVDRFIAVSGAVRDLLVRDGIGEAMVSVVRSGVDPGRLRPHPPADSDGLRRELSLPPGLPIVAAVGALADHKGHRFLVEAAPRILARRDAAFVIAGDGPRRRSLARQARRLGIDGRLRLIGFRHDVDRILASAAAFVFPSLEEGLGTSILDALLLERPVVATRAGGIPEMIEPGIEGILVPPRDPAAIAEAVLRVLEDPEAAGEMARRGRERVEREFTVDRMVDGTLAVYRELFPGAGAADGPAACLAPHDR
jgi:glycosyltransferase involved in cell wall biosynthesis